MVAKNPRPFRYNKCYVYGVIMLELCILFSDKQLLTGHHILHYSYFPKQNPLYFIWIIPSFTQHVWYKNIGNCYVYRIFTDRFAIICQRCLFVLTKPCSTSKCKYQYTAYAGIPNHFSSSPL